MLPRITRLNSSDGDEVLSDLENYNWDKEGLIECDFGVRNVL